MLKKQDFYFDLPEELIAQTPLEDRSSSRLMVMDRETGEIEHKHFSRHWHIHVCLMRLFISLGIN